MPLFFSESGLLFPRPTLRIRLTLSSVLISTPMHYFSSPSGLSFDELLWFVSKGGEGWRDAEREGGTEERRGDKVLAAKNPVEIGFDVSF